MSLATDYRSPDIATVQIHSPVIDSHTAADLTLDNWHFNAFACSPELLVSHVVSMFKRLGLCEHCAIDERTLHTFVSNLQQTYRAANQFHNFVHAFDVTQAMFCLLSTFDVRRHVSLLEQLALMVAAIGHDAAHVGRTNSFLVATAHPLAVLYSDTSVLENHHCATTFRVLTECDLLRSLTDSDRRAVCRLVKTAILATDMAHHQQWVERIEQSLSRHHQHNANALNDSELMAATLLKFCDITNVFRATSLAETWMQRITDEYFVQGDDMRQRHEPVPEMFDRSAVRPRQLITLGFIGAVVEPFFDRCIAPLLAVEHAHFLRSQMEQNVVVLRRS